MSLTVVSSAGLVLVQDRGRRGLSGSGVSPSGAFDRLALDRANRILGNPPETAGLEIVGSLALTADSNHVVTVSGAVGPLDVDGAGAHQERPIPLRAGQRLTIGTAMMGLRTYLGVQGGIDARAELGSRSRDTLSGLGPAPLTPGEVLAVGSAGGESSAGEEETRLSATDVVLRAHPGPRDDWFTTDALRKLYSTGWVVDSRSDRIGVRLDGPPLARAVSAELPSEPCLRGSIQVSRDGRPIVFGPDHPVTGGYPVIAVVADNDTDLLAQTRPGQTVRFRRV